MVYKGFNVFKGALSSQIITTHALSLHTVDYRDKLMLAMDTFCAKTLHDLVEEYFFLNITVLFEVNIYAESNRSVKTGLSFSYKRALRNICRENF